MKAHEARLLLHLCSIALIAIQGQPHVAAAQSSEVLHFILQNRRFAAYTGPLAFIEAVSSCNTVVWSQGDSTQGALLSASQLGEVLAGVARDQPQTAQALRSALMDSATGGQEQQQWALWTWDEYRVCRAAKLLPTGSSTGGSSGDGGSSSGGSGAGPDLTLVTTDRPCSWRLAYVCAEEQAVVLAAGLSSSSAWYRRHFAPGAPAPLLPSPYTAASAAAGLAGAGSSSSEGSSSQAELALYRSGFVAGGPLGELNWAPDVTDTMLLPTLVEPFPVTTEVEDGADRFWRLGPIVTAMYRGGNRRLTALRLVREGEAADVWAAYQGQSSGAGLPPPLGDEFVLGNRVPDYDLGRPLTGAPLGSAGPGYETYNVGPYNDYIVAVEGCFRASEVEGLTLLSRSGRRLQLGRGGCSNWFREEAPPGGYLAGAWSSALNASAWDRYIDVVYLRGNLGQLSNGEMPWLHQLSFIWAAPSGSPPPVWVVRRAPVLDTWRQPPACPWTPPMADRFYLVSYTACHMMERMCSSNACCNQAVRMHIHGTGGYPRCGANRDACLTACMSAGICGTIPEANILHFLAAAPPRLQPQLSISGHVVTAADSTAPGPDTAAMASFIMYRTNLMSYADAVQYCASSSYMGADWELIEVQDALDWAASAWTRRDAHEALASLLGYVWAAPLPRLLANATAQPPAPSSSGIAGSSCMRVAFGLPDGLDSPSSTDSHTVAVGDCEAQAAVVCRAVAKPLSASAAAAAVAAAAVQAAEAAVADADTSTTSGLAGVDVGSTYPLASAVLGGGSSLGDRGLISPAAAAAVWVPGPHTLTVSNRRLGSGPYLNGSADKTSYCNAAIGSIVSSNSSSSSTGAIAGQRATAVVTLQQPVTAISVSVAVQLSNETDSVAVLSAVRLRVGTGGSWQSMGLVSSGGWETFQLAPGEVVVAVSGCMGGFVERLVFHTNTGRRWTHALLGAAAACSVPFLDSAPQQPAAGGGGGYLVGMQGSVGYYIGSLQLVWGSPSQAVSGALGPTAAVLPDGVPPVDGTRPQRPSAVLPSQGAGAPGAGASSSPSGLVKDNVGTGGASSSMAPSNVGSSGGIPTAAVAAGAATAGVAAVVAAAALAVVVVRRRRRGQQELGTGKAPPAAQDGSIAGAVGDGSDGSSRLPSQTLLPCVPVCAKGPAPLAYQQARGKAVAVRLSSVRLMLSTQPTLPLSSCSHSVHARTLSSAAATSPRPGDAAPYSSASGGPDSKPAANSQGSRVGGPLPAAHPGGIATGGDSSGLHGGSCGPAAAPTAALLPGCGGSAAPAAPPGADAHGRGGGPAAGQEREPRASSTPEVVQASTLTAWPTATAAGIASQHCQGPARQQAPYWLGATAAAATSSGGIAAGSPAAGLSTAAAAPPQAAVTAMHHHPSELESRLSAYIMRVDERQPRHLDRAASGNAEATAGAAADVGVRLRPPSPQAAGLAADGTQPRNSDGEEDDRAAVHAAISEAVKAELAGRQGGCWQGLLIQGVLGRGGFGVVYLGTWRNLRVAIKTLVVHDALAGGKARQRHRAIIEAAISKSLQHPNVVTTYEAEVVPLAVVPSAAAAGAVVHTTTQGKPVEEPTGDDNDVYKLLIIQEYCNVGPLTTALDAGVFGSIADGGTGLLCGLTLALDVACGMRHIHSRNIIHGDLSAGNVLLSSVAGFGWGRLEAQANEVLPPAQSVTSAAGACSIVAGGSVDPGAPAVAESDAQLLRPLAGLWRPPVTAKVSDFGLSLPMGENQTHASNRFQGTPGYAAPEVLSRGRLSLAADVWSFGVLLLELCHGMRFKRIIAQQQAASGGVAGAGVAGAGVAGAGEEQLGEGAGIADGGSTTGSAPAWAVLPATCPPQLTALVRACLSLSPPARPSFDQVARQLVSVLAELHAACC